MTHGLWFSSHIRKDVGKRFKVTPNFDKDFEATVSSKTQEFRLINFCVFGV